MSGVGPGSAALASLLGRRAKLRSSRTASMRSTRQAPLKIARQFTLARTCPASSDSMGAPDSPRAESEAEKTDAPLHSRGCQSASAWSASPVFGGHELAKRLAAQIGAHPEIEPTTARRRAA